MKTYSMQSLLFVLFVLSFNAVAEQPEPFGKLDISAAIKSLPEASDKPYVDVRLVDNGTTGVRVFRVYNPVQRHNHAFSSTYLKIESGRAIFRLEGETTFEAGAGEVIFWQQGIDHEVVEILKEPLVFLAIDTPTRRVDDVQK